MREIVELAELVGNVAAEIQLEFYSLRKEFGLAAKKSGRLGKKFCRVGKEL
ncbi:hypothetical protein [Candidatus Electronema sp. PJ]|uniref:hypothetical protein n=1 Tax=Candidatus Electronema sp. PJ TaxID=3401572 RepID=UPI003AA8B7BB